MQITSTVCLIARDEERSIAEWLAYQKIIGFDRIVVYDNESIDKTKEIVIAAGRADHSISYVYWPNVAGKKIQISAYEHAVAHCRSTWIAFLDTDEFLLLNKHESVSNFLGGMNKEVGGVAINWRLFGSSGLEHFSNDLVIRRFVRCSTAQHGKNLIVKSFVRPEAVVSIATHTCQLREGFHYVDPAGNRLQFEANAGKSTRVSIEEAQVNHYVVKSREEFIEKRYRGDVSKTPEGRSQISIKYRDDDFFKHHDLNDEKDDRIVRYADEVVSLMLKFKTS